LANDNDDRANLVFKNKTFLVHESRAFVGRARGAQKIHLKSRPFLGVNDSADNEALLRIAAPELIKQI